MKPPQTRDALRQNLISQNLISQNLIISAVTLPTLALLFATRQATVTLVKIGIWSEELLRGDRAPLRSVDVRSVNPDSSDAGD